MQEIDETTPPGPGRCRTAAEDRRLQPYYNALSRCHSLYKEIGYPLIWDIPEFRANPLFAKYFAATGMFNVNPRVAREMLDSLCAELELSSGG